MKFLAFSILTLTLSTSLYTQPIGPLVRLARVAQRLHTRRLQRISALKNEIAHLKKENAETQNQLRNLKKELEREINLLRMDLKHQIQVYRHR